MIYHLLCLEIKHGIKNLRPPQRIPVFKWLSRDRVKKGCQPTAKARHKEKVKGTEFFLIRISWKPDDVKI